MDKKYEAIIDLPHHVSPNRPKMSLPQRAAQFAPFAALTGYDAVLAETARRTEGKTELGEDEIAAINRRLCWLKENLKANPQVAVKVFCPDDRKAGGSYCTIHGKVLKIDENQRQILMENGEIIQFKNIMQLIVL